jgi:divinyl protochlorophyllide a 8-vinyl-reductase
VSLHAASHRIGPNSVLQLLPVLDTHLGSHARDALLQGAGLSQPPSDHGLMDETPAALLHQALRREYPQQAGTLAREAGERTGDYIIAHRIPRLVVKLLPVLPARVACSLLATAIEKHAWTFAGSGHFRVLSRNPLVFELADNPVVRGESAPAPVCDWHAAVFQRLFNVLVNSGLECRETHCCACGEAACRFTIS